ncbi:MAG TPA: SDR family NAD(P)-dependent oxidoreductase [Terriglobales bacterium]|nr:SDR family NAD(P)-dependent oxidoreductase [Terriglobales bacterium]
MPVTLSLEGRVALITGGSRGIGAAAVRMFVEAGARVLFNYERAQAAAEKLTGECNKKFGDGKCAALRCNLEGTESAKELVVAAVRQFGRLDILVANHGVWPAEDLSIDKMSDEHWRRTMAINLDAVFALVKHSVAEMKKHASAKSPAHIVLISSTSGQRGEAFHADYSATKGAIISMTKSFASELARNHIYVNSVAPGWVDTDMSRPALEDPAIAREVLRPIPLKRVGTPEEVAGPILFLCTPHAGFITGEILNVNGGAVLVG